MFRYKARPSLREAAARSFWNSRSRAIFFHPARKGRPRYSYVVVFDKSRPSAIVTDVTVETVRLSPLPFLEERSLDEQRAFYVDAVHEVERKTAQMHKDNGTTPMGARAIRRQKPHDKPKAFKPSPAPLFHAANREDFWAMYNARQAKVTAYRDAAERLKRGETDVSFPEGCFPPRLPFVKAPAPT